MKLEDKIIQLADATQAVADQLKKDHDIPLAVWKLECLAAIERTLIPLTSRHQKLYTEHRTGVGVDVDTRDCRLG